MLDQYRELIDELLGTPGIVRRLLEADATGSGSSPVDPLLTELRDRDRTVLARLQTMTREPEPYLREIGTAPGKATEESAEGLIDQFDTARGDLVSLLMNLTLRDWERTAIDETIGETSLADEVERHVEFDEAQLARIRAAAPAA